MTESIYICAGSLCCCLVVCALVRLIAPSGNTNKILSVVIGIFTLCCMLSPVYSLLTDFNVSAVSGELELTSDEFAEICDEQVLHRTADYINEYAESLLTEADIKCKNIETIVAANQNRGIYIREMNIYIDKNQMDKAQEISELIYSGVGVEPIITER